MAVECAGDGPELAAGVKRIAGYAVPAWRFEDGPHAAGALAAAARVLQCNDTPHNVLLARGASVLIPRVAQDAVGPCAGVAFLELSGEVLVIGGGEAEPLRIVRETTDEEAERRIAAAALPAEEFARLELDMVRSLARG
jgi:hypothetical protein